MARIVEYSRKNLQYTRSMQDYAYTSVKRWKVMLLQKLRLHFVLVYSRGEQKLYIILSEQT